MTEVDLDRVGAPTNWEELFAAQQQATRTLIDRHQELAEVIARLDEPASIEPIQLTASSPVQESSSVTGTRAIGLLVPIQATNSVAIGIFGSAQAADAIQVPAGGLLVLPIRAGAVEVAAVGTIGAGATIYAFLLRWKSVQRSQYS